jgi:hypothetical protein
MSTEGVTSLSAELAALIPALQSERHRYPVVRTKRTEERAAIKREDRIAVYIRDHFRCVWCGKDENLTLDHIIPWSAGGSDDVDNLRTLCWDCNEYRSNFHHSVDEAMTRVLPLTFWCADCDPDEQNPPSDHPGVQPAFCYWCKHESVGIPGRWFMENNTYWDYDLNWHREKPRGEAM